MKNKCKFKYIAKESIKNKELSKLNLKICNIFVDLIVNFIYYFR